MIATINQAINAIIAWNNLPDQRHDEKWAITINGLKTFINAQNRILEVLENRAEEIKAHHERLGRKFRAVVRSLSSDLPDPSTMTTASPFKWRHFLPEIILLNVRWYCLYSLSYRNLEEMMAERGVEVDRSTINRWLLKYTPELDKRVRPHLQPSNDSWRVDETYIQIKGEWKYLYRAVGSQGNTLDFMLSAKRDGKAAARFFRKVLKSNHVTQPRVINADKNAAYPVAIERLKSEQTLAVETELRQVKYLNNRVEQDHRHIKRIVKPMLGFKSFHSARRTLSGIEAMSMIRKGQVEGVERGDVRAQVEFVSQIFGLVA